MNFKRKIVDSFSELKSTKSLVLLALLIAIYSILSYFTVYITQTLRMSFTFVPVVIAGALFGPVGGGFVGALGDLVGYITSQFQGGSFFPGFTINAFINGFIYGLILYKSDFSIMKVIAAKIILVLIVELTLTPIWLSLLYGKSFTVLLTGRIMKTLIFIPIEVVIISVIVKKIYLYINASVHKEKFD